MLTVVLFNCEFSSLITFTFRITFSGSGKITVTIFATEIKPRYVIRHAERPRYIRVAPCF